MKAWPFLQLSGVEVSNANRVLAYVESLLGGHGFQVNNSSETCFCDAVDFGPYESPAVDLAPWYDGSVDAGEFLGFYAHDIRVTGSILRAVTPRGAGGASLSRERAQHKTVSVSGFMFATGACGMDYGERWLAHMLRGQGGCAADALEILPCCPDAEYSPSHFKTLTGVGLIDGPNYTDVESIGACYMQQASFQLAAANAFYLIGAPTVCFAETVLADNSYVKCSFTGASNGDTSTIITIVAGTADVSGLEVIGEPCGGYEDTYLSLYDDDAPGSMEYAEYRVTLIPAGHRLIIDAAAETVELIDDASSQVVGGFDALTFRGAFQWIRATGGTNACAYVSALPADATLNAATTVTIETVDRHT